MALRDPLNLVGQTIAEKYAIEAVVGEGGFAVVYRAQHLVWKRPVAIKIFRTFGALPPETREDLKQAFIQEGAVLSQLSSRSTAIVQARDVGTLRGVDGRDMLYMVLEWLDGRTLERVLEDERAAGIPPRTPEEAVRFLEPAAEALALAHRNNVAHRDMKPANVFVLGDARGEFTIKLLDFGIAKVVQDAQRTGGAFAQTQGLVTSFTPAYGAPEQFSRRNGATGPWTDVFALALIFTEVVTCRSPLAGDDVAQFGFASMDPNVRPTPRALGANVSDALEAALTRAVAVNVADRYQTVGEFWDALRVALAMSPSEANRGFTLGLGGNTLAVPPSAALPQPSGQPPVVGSTQLLSGPSGQRTAPIPLPPPSEPEKSARTATVVVIAGAAVLLGAAALGVGFVAKRGDASRSTPLASVSPSSAAPTSAPLPPREECPEGTIKIPGGRYFMGSDDRRDEEKERPAHQVILTSYCIDRFEVTVEKYKACSDRGHCKRAPEENDFPGLTPAEHKIYDPLCNIRDAATKAKHPINCIDWGLATAFCKAEGRRLPTEAEWEYATRGSDGRRYPWGDDAPTAEHLNACGSECVAWGKKRGQEFEAMYAADDRFATTAPVGQFPKGASPFGVEDVVGNVFEWVADWYGPYGADAQTNPQGPPSGDERVMRGGAWNGEKAAWVRPTYRFSVPPGFRSHGIGFRCAMNATNAK